MRPLLALGILAVLVPAASPGQSPPRPATPEELARAVASAWQEGDAEAVAELLSPQGVALELPGSSNPAVRPQQARAALDRVFREHRPGPVEVVEVRQLGGTPEQGLARLAWRPGRGGTVPQMPIFLALQRTAGGWTVTEVRLVRLPAPQLDTPRRSPCP